MGCAKVALDAHACHTESCDLSKCFMLQQVNVEGLITPQSLICHAFMMALWSTHNSERGKVCTWW